MTDLGYNIRTQRKKHSISQLALARQLNVSQSAVAHYEKGDREPTIDNLIRLSDIFGVSIDALVGKADDRSRSLRVDRMNRINELLEMMISSEG